MVKTWLESIAQNLVAELLFVLFLLALGWLLYRVTHRRPLLSFFGITRSKRLMVYLSNLSIQRGGAMGVDGRARSFGESALPAYEVNLIPWLQRLFNYVVPGTTEQPGLLKWLQLSDVAVEFVPSPFDEAAIESQSTFIAVGSPGYNRASSHIEDSLHSIGRLQMTTVLLCYPELRHWIAITTLLCSEPELQNNAHFMWLAYRVEPPRALCGSLQLIGAI